MMKPTKFLRKQADRAERALSASDPELTARLRAMASAYRAQADIIKSKKKKKSR
jgi:ABC-type Zn uptake system ZnuABC Zn-binding protein ZnuA